MNKLERIQEAKKLIEQVAHQTPLDYSKTFSNLTGNEVYLKLENMQKTGSFKVRGAYNKIQSLTEEEKKCGVIAASAGNHAQGVAFSANAAGIESTIVMPVGAPLAKVQATKNYGANVVLFGETFDEALAHAYELQEKTGATFIHPFDDEQVIEGQGTVGLEIFEQLPELDAIVCPIGGGGLISGIAMAVKALKPSVKIYGVQAAACPGMKNSLEVGTPVMASSHATIADGIAVKKPGILTFDLVKNYVDEICLVDDMEISRAMLYLLERNKLLVEGSGAAALAALLYEKLPLKGKKIAVIVSGGNVDVNFISKIIDHGLVESGRYVRFTTVIEDKSGQLNRLLDIVAEEKANVISITHNRRKASMLIGQVEIDISLETKNREHIDKIETRLTKSGYKIVERN